MIFMKKLTTRLLSLVLLGAFIPSFVLADTWDLGKGDITVTATETNQTVSQKNGETKDDPAPVITSSGTTENTVTINAAAADARTAVTAGGFQAAGAPLWGGDGQIPGIFLVYTGVIGAALNAVVPREIQGHVALALCGDGGFRI